MENKKLMTDHELAIELSKERELCDALFQALFVISTYGSNKVPLSCYAIMDLYTENRNQWNS